MGCYVGTRSGTANGWLEIPCLDEQFVVNTFGRPDVDKGLGPSTTSSAVPLVFGQVETTIIDLTTQNDVYDPVRHGNDGCGGSGPASGDTITPNQWSVQNRTIFFGCAFDGPQAGGPYDGVVQFTIQTEQYPGEYRPNHGSERFHQPFVSPRPTAGHRPATTIPTTKPTTNNALEDRIFYIGVPTLAANTRSGPLMPSDFANIWQRIHRQQRQPSDQDGRPA